MKKTSNNTLYFLEVEKEDKKTVQDKYPTAIITDKSATERYLIEQCTNAEILCPFIYTKITKKVIDNLPNLKLIITRSVGYNHIDLAAASSRNVHVSNVPDYGSHVIAEHVFALLLSGLRHVKEAGERIEQKKQFSFSGLRGTTLRGKTMGIIGTGKIGINVARIASSGFLMNVLANDPKPNTDAALENHFKYTDIETIWKNADIITLHCPLLKSTKHLINENTLEEMKDGVVIVNTSRGGVIKTEALIETLNSGKVSYAFLDVLEHENNIKKAKELIELPNVTVTPHIAFYADDSMGTMYKEAFSVIDTFIKTNEVLNKVTGL